MIKPNSFSSKVFLLLPHWTHWRFSCSRCS